MNPSKIGIVGASIVGMACAILLHRAGFKITVFEQRAADWADERGAGLVLPCELIDQLKIQNLLDNDFSPLLIKSRDLYALDKEHDIEYLLMSHDSHINTINWSTLYQQLKKRLPKELINYNFKLERVAKKNQTTRLSFNNKQDLDFDYVIFADGSQSVARRYLFPTARPQFAGYIAWRTLVTTRDVNEIERLIQRQILYGYSRGIGFAYLIPSQNDNEYTINCLIYDKITEDHPLFKGDLDKANKNISPDFLPESYLSYYKALVETEFPPLARQLFSKGKPFVQTICDTLIEKYYKNRMALIGDASTLLRPISGSGATKGLQDALALAKCLAKFSELEDAFTIWSENQSKNAQNLFDLGNKLSDFYVMNTPDWNHIKSEEIHNIWSSIVKNTNWYITKAK